MEDLNVNFVKAHKIKSDIFPKIKYLNKHPVSIIFEKYKNNFK